MSARILALLASLFFVICTINPVAAQESAEETPETEPEKKSFFSQFKDPDDGMLDMSDDFFAAQICVMPRVAFITEVFFYRHKDSEKIKEK